MLAKRVGFSGSTKVRMFVTPSGPKTSFRSATAAADAFFETTYTPLGNASYRQGLPNLDTGIGFGFTDVPIATMLSFVSEQTVTHRLTGDRFGYAFVPKNATGRRTL